MGFISEHFGDAIDYSDWEQDKWEEEQHSAEDADDICPSCNGSGEGASVMEICGQCGGSGVI